jgi:hypothetical protein
MRNTRVSVIISVLLILLFVALSGCTKTNIRQNNAPVPPVSAPQAPQTIAPKSKVVTPVPIPLVTQNVSPAPEILPPMEYTVTADDYGIYQEGQSIDSLTAPKGNIVKITINVQDSKVYHGGLQAKGCGQDTGKIAVGDSATLTFKLDNNCRISTYWPNTDVFKASISIESK